MNLLLSPLQDVLVLWCAMVLGVANVFSQITHQADTFPLQIESTQELHWCGSQWALWWTWKRHSWMASGSCATGTSAASLRVGGWASPATTLRLKSLHCKSSLSQVTCIHSIPPWLETVLATLLKGLVAQQQNRCSALLQRNSMQMFHLVVVIRFLKKVSRQANLFLLMVHISESSWYLCWVMGCTGTCQTLLLEERFLLRLDSCQALKLCESLSSPWMGKWSRMH